MVEQLGDDFQSFLNEEEKFNDILRKPLWKTKADRSRKIRGRRR